MSRKTTSLEEWIPRTRIGRMVKEGHITTIDEIFQNALPIREPEIVDILLPNLREEVVDITLVQKQTDAGEISRFRVTVIIGNEDGYIGIGEGKAPEIGPAIRNAIHNAKLNIIPVRRGCGSWECGCGRMHSIPFKVVGKAGSVEVMLMPAPRGTGLVVADAAKAVLSLAGIKDVWSKTKGHTKTTLNFVKATYLALKQTYEITPAYDWAR
ncbi:MAG: 30S ribosomal protein S5 [Candidatus Asgardarchaeia archaeon]